MIPGYAVGFRLSDCGICEEYTACSFVGVKVIGPARPEHGTRQAALSSAIGARQDIDARTAISHASERLPQLVLVAWARRQKRTSYVRESLASACVRAVRQIHCSKH